MTLVAVFCGGPNAVCKLLEGRTGQRRAEEILPSAAVVPSGAGILLHKLCSGETC
jgi:hypothetical protein